MTMFMRERGENNLLLDLSLVWRTQLRHLYGFVNLKFHAVYVKRYVNMFLMDGFV